MKPFVVLIGAFLLSLWGTDLFTGKMDLVVAGHMAMGVMLLFTAIGHFAFREGMEMMIPAFVPFKAVLVWGTGILEILAGLGWIFGIFLNIIAWILIFFFILILPANIYAAKRKVDYQRGTFDGPGTRYLWFRIPLQLLYIAWVWYFGIYPY